MSIKKILMIDDSEAEQFLCRHLIKSYDSSIELLFAYDGIDALELLETTEELPEIILLDINMPRMNGLEFLERFIETYKDNTSRIAMLSSSVREKESVSKYKCVLTYFEKPLNKAHLDFLNE